MSDMMIPIELSDDIESKQVEALREYLGEYVDNIYYFPARPLVPFCYYEDFTWLHLFSLDVDHMKKNRMKEMIENRRKQVQELLKKQKFDSLLSLTEKVIKITMFKKYFDEIPDHKKYDTFRSVYRSSEYNFGELDSEFLEDVFSYRHYSKDWEQNMKKIEEKADEDGWLTIYRGQGSKSTSIDQALSWSINKNVARFFAKRFNKQGIVWEAKVHLSDVLDYLPERNEEEVLVEYDALCHIKKLK